MCCIGHGQSQCALLQIEAAVQGQASWLFQLVGDAHTVLSNPQSRKTLDRDLAFNERSRSQPRATARSDFPFSRPYTRDSYSFGCGSIAHPECIDWLRKDLTLASWISSADHCAACKAMMTPYGYHF